MIERVLERRQAFLFGASSILLIATYVIVGGIYRPQNLDDGWTLSALYEFYRHGNTQDTIFGATLASEGQDGVYHFAKLQATIYGLILDVVGWTRSAGHAISTFFVTLGAITWGLIARRITSNNKLAIATVITLLFSEPLFGPAHQSRPEALTFFLATAALALYLYQRSFLAGLFIGAAFEVHPVGLFAGLYVAAAFFTNVSQTGFRQTILNRSTAFFLFGCLLGIVGYLVLHADALSTLLQTFSQSNNGSQNFLVSYFFKAKYMRHIPELVFFIIMVVLFIRGNHWKDVPFIAWLVICVAVSLLFLHRGNMHYVLYVYAPMMLLSLWVAEKYRRLHIVFAICVGFFASQLSAVYVLNQSYSFDAYTHAVSNEIPNDELAVVGTSNDWFIYQERDFYAFTYGPEAFIAVAPREFYLIRNDSPYMSFPKDRFYAIVDENYMCLSISSFTVGGEDVQIDRCER